jgi:hypothetical protein
MLADEVQQFRLNSHEIDLSELGAIRTAHETDFAKKAVRTGSSLQADGLVAPIYDAGDTPFTAHLARQQLVKRMHESLKTLEDNVGSATGAVRRLHHEGKVETVRAGNSANASAVAGQRNAAVGIHV